MSYLSLVLTCRLIFFFKQKTAYEMRISDWSSDVCSSDLPQGFVFFLLDRLGQAVIGGIERSFVPFAANLIPQQLPELHCHPRPEIGRVPCRERVCQYV